MATMVEKAKELIGHMLRNVRSSDDKRAASSLSSDHDLTIESDSFRAGMAIPQKYTQDGENVSPALEWSGVPVNAISVAIVCEDPDAPAMEPIVHWIAYNIPPRLGGVPEALPVGDLPHGGKQGKNYVGEERYIGPKPPLGHGVHHYHFQVFALDQDLTFNGTPDKHALLDAMRGHVIGEGEIVGTYERTAK